MTRYIV